MAEVNIEDRVLSFEEKPLAPRSNNAVPPFYLYTKETVLLIQYFLASGANADVPGQFVAWLVDKVSVYAYKFSGRRYDIGSLVSYEEARRVFKI